MDRLIWAFNYAEVCNRENFPIGVHSPSHAIHRLYLSLLPKARGRKTSWNIFMRTLLQPVDGMLAKAQESKILSSEQISIIKAAMRSSLSGPFQNYLIYNWLTQYFRDLEMSEFLTDGMSNMSPYSALELFNDDEDALKTVLKSNGVDVERVPSFLSLPWVRNRPTHAFTETLTDFFSYDARKRLFVQYTKVHWIYLMSFDAVHHIRIDFAEGRDRHLAVLEDLAEDLQHFELLNMRELTTESQIENSFLDEPFIQVLELEELFCLFLEALIAKNFFKEDDFGTFLPNPWIRPKLWMLLGRFFTVAFQRGIKFPANLRLKRSFFRTAFNQRFAPQEHKSRPSFIQFSEKEHEFIFNRQHQFRELIKNREETCRRLIAYSHHLEAVKDTNFYRFFSLKGGQLFASEPPQDFEEDDAPTELSLKRLVRRAVREGMFKFWLGLEPLVSFFTADEVYNALFDTSGSIDGSNSSGSSNRSSSDRSSITDSGTNYSGYESEMQVDDSDDPNDVYFY